MKEKLTKNIAKYVEAVGADTAEEIARKSIPGLLFDGGNVVGIDNLIMAMVKFQIEVLVYLRADRDKVDELVIDFAKEAAGE